MSSILGRFNLHGVRRVPVDVRHVLDLVLEGERPKAFPPAGLGGEEKEERKPKSHPRHDEKRNLVISSEDRLASPEQPLLRLGSSLTVAQLLLRLGHLPRHSHTVAVVV